MRHSRHKIAVILAHVFLCLFMILAAKSLTNPTDAISSNFLSDEKTYFANNRHLLASNLNCTPRSVEEFPPDFMTLREKRNGGVVIHIFLFIYLFAALAVICDDYFVASMEHLCDDLKLKPDVAGASFMAAGSSAPELATSIIGVFFTKSDVGVSTIVGSAVFNILFIAALCGIFGGMVIKLTWWPLFRDCVFYCISVLALIVVLNDDFIHWYESVIFLFLYVGYITVMYFNDKAEFLVTMLFSKCKRKANLKRKSEKTPLVRGDATRFGEENDIELSSSTKENLKEEEDWQSPLTVPDTFVKRIYWVAMLPITILVLLTVPDCRKPGSWRKKYFLTLIFSVIWIAGLSYILVWMVVATGDTFDIPDTVMGLTLLAAGTSIPDALSSVFVARDGFGDMAISNGIGSNIFDILICLGLPWFLQTGITSPGSTVPINSSGLIYSAIILFATVVILVLAIKINGWRLTQSLGIILLITYFVVITFSCMNELNLFGVVAKPSCPRTRE